MWLSGCQADVKKWPNIFCKTIEFTTSYCHFLRIYSELIKNMIEWPYFYLFCKSDLGRWITRTSPRVQKCHLCKDLFKRIHSTKVEKQNGRERRDFKNS